MTQEHRAGLARFAWLTNFGYVPVALLASWGFFAIGGIPKTHDGLGLVQIETYRRAYRALDLLPVWASSLSNGHGSPFPILYHRLHGQVFGAVALLTGSVTALKLSVPLLMVVGASGMRRLCLGQGTRPWIAWVAGALFLSSNYVFCDWFVRGAIAEFTAFMLVPWCLHFTIRTVDEISSPWWMAFFGALLFLAHMMTAYFYAFMVLAVLVTRLVRMRRFGWRRTRETWRRLAIFSFLVLAATGLFAAASQYALGFSHVSSFGMRADKDAYFTWSETLFDPNLSWVRAIRTGEMTVEIGRWPLLFLALLLLVDRSSRHAVWHKTHGMLVPAVLFFILQDKRLSFVFDLVPGASKAQFPCRLLTFIVPVMLLAWAVAVEHALRARAPVSRWIAALSPLAMVGQLSLIAQLQLDVRSRSYESGDVDVAMWNSDPTRPPLMLYPTWDGFLPDGLSTVARAPFLAASSGCTISSPRLNQGQSTTDVQDSIEFEALELTVHGSGCLVHFAEFRTPLLAIQSSKPAFSYADKDGTTILDVPSDGTVVHISQRSISDLARRWIIWKLRSKSS